MRVKVMKLFYLIFAVSFGWLFCNLIVQKDGMVSEELGIVFWILCALTICFLFYKLFQKWEQRLEQLHGYVVAIFLVIMGTAQFTIGLELRYEPAWDLKSIFDGAIEWVRTGTFASYYEYFYWFPNNLGGLNFFHKVFWLADKLGMTDYFNVAMLVNCVMSLMTIYMLSAVCRKLYGVKGEMMALVFVAISPPFYFIAPVFYTDSLSMVFPIAVYYFYLCFKGEETLWKRLVFGIFMGLFAVVGMQIKFTVLIVLIAIGIEALFTYKFKRTAAMFGIVLCIVLAGYGWYNNTIYEEHLEEETADIMNTPYLHWVMMGLSDNGSYNPYDYEFTRSFTDIEERDEALKEEIGNRMKTRGLVGMGKHLTMKAEVCFSCGTYGLQEFLDDEPQKESVFHSFLLSDGEHYKTYEGICKGVLYAIYLLMIFAAVGELVLGEKDSWKNMVPFIATFGLMLFLVFWEARGRYIVNYVPLYMIAAIGGWEQTRLFQKCKK